ncbi:facilitated trehalose transporter Tret1-like [Zophobas morio]|uniref:facilitated trehalose transporter Tret1-like n=1 Tax=Zophobas morio TaxID=2755281 RepID=UPI003083DB81
MLKILSYTVLTVLTVDLLATSGDITMTWTSPMLPKLYSNDSDENPFDQPITADEDSWIGSLINIGAMIGPLPYGFISEKFGRKIGLLCIAIPHIISYLTLAFSRTVGLYYFARLLGGLAVGGGYTLLPTYVAEVSEDKHRGMMSATLNCFWTFGTLLPYVIGPYTSALWLNVILACVPTSFFILFFFIGPESPYYLIAKNKMDLAEQSLMKLRSQDQKGVETEMKQIQAELAENTDAVSILKFFKNRIYMKGLFISVLLLVIQQLSGINAVLFYTQEIFIAAGASDIAPEISSIIVGLVIFFSSFGTPFVADRAGRRILMLISLMGVTISHLAFGVYFYLKDRTSEDVSSISWLPLLSFLAYIVTFNVGLGALPWTISSELFPTNVKSYSAAIVSFSCWTTSFFVTKFFNDLQVGLGSGETFWLFSGCCFAGWLFTFIFVPETKGKSFQEIQEILERRRF